MQEALINLGAEVLSTMPEEVVTDVPRTKGILFYGVDMAICMFFLVWIYLSYLLIDNLFLIIAVYIIGFIISNALLVIWGKVKSDLLRKKTGNTLFEIRINNQTDLNGIFEQFKVVDISNYPVITVCGGFQKIE